MEEAAAEAREVGLGGLSPQLQEHTKEGMLSQTLPAT